MSVLRIPQPAILSEIPATGHVLIEASAGTGKTFTLEHLVVHLVLTEGATMDQLLVLSFTEKATRELRERIRKKLYEFAQWTEDSERAPSWAVGPSEQKRLREAALGFDQATIATIHGFCQRVLTEQAFDHQRLFEQEQVDGREAFGRAFREELRRVLAEEDPLADAVRRVLEQRFTAEDLEERLFAIARERGELTPRWDPGALFRVLEALPLPAAVAAGLASYVEGPGGLTSRALQSLIEGYEELYDQAQAARGSGDALGFGEAFEGWARRPRFLRGVKAPRLTHLRAELEQAVRFGAHPALEMLLANLPELERLAAGPLSFLAGTLLPRVERRLGVRKASAGQFDFDDMLVLVERSLSETVSGRALTEALRRRYRFALIDEFQDTDEVQWSIFRKLFADAGPKHRLFLIGDPKQAIYSFRSADVETYRRAAREIAAGGGRVLALTENFRSSPRLIEAVNAVLAQDFFSGHNRYEHPVRPGRLDLAFVNVAGEPQAPLVLVQPATRGEALTSDRIRSALHRFIAAEIAELLGPNGGRVVSAAGARPLVANDIFVLTRSAFEGRELGRVLSEARIPHAFYRQDGLFQTPEAEDILHLLAAVANPSDGSARAKAWLTPFFGVELDALGQTRDLPETHGLIKRLLDFKGIADQLDYARLFDLILEETGLVRALLFQRNDERALTNYLHVFELLLEEAHLSPYRLPELVDHLRAITSGLRAPPGGREGNVQRLESERASVQILTKHAAKGLEAPVVFLAGGYQPTGAGFDRLQVYYREHQRHAHLGASHGWIKDAIERAQREEAERLLYVALTRAQVRLYVPYFHSPPSPRAELNYRVDRLDPAYRALSQSLESATRRVQDPRACFRYRLAVLNSAAWARGPGEGTAPALDPAWLDEEVLAPPRIAPENAPITVTSYSRLLRSDAPFRTEEARFGEDLLAEGEDRALVTEPNGELPGGKASGVFLHQILEQLPYASVRAPRAFSRWYGDSAVRTALSRAAAQHGIAEIYLPHTARLIFATLRAPIQFPNLSLPDGLAALEKTAAELEFLYPIPSSGPDFWAARPPPIERGYIEGVIDLVFDFGGRFFFLDWKSDRLPSFEAGALKEHVDRDYGLQVELYTLGVARLLGIASAADYEARFGGLLYAFVRGMRDSGPPNVGLYFARPAFAEVLDFADRLAERAESLNR